MLLWRYFVDLIHIYKQFTLNKTDDPSKHGWVSSNWVKAFRTKTGFPEKNPFKTTETLFEFPACWFTLQILGSIGPVSREPWLIHSSLQYHFSPLPIKRWSLFLYLLNLGLAIWFAFANETLANVMQAKIGKVLVNWSLPSPATGDPFATKGISMINLMDNERHRAVVPADITPTARHNIESLTRPTSLSTTRCEWSHPRILSPNGTGP